MLSLLWRRASQRKRRGGWRQQLRDQSDSDEFPRSGMSSLAAGHLLEWCDGNSSAGRVVKHMRNAEKDGLSHPMVHQVAQAGEGQHAHAGLMAMLDRVGFGSLLTPLEGPSAVTWLCLPSALVSNLCKAHTRDFRLRLGAGTDKCRAFWTNFLGKPGVLSGLLGTLT